MYAELSVALNFIISHLYNKLPRRRVDVFREELERGFVRRFDGHWYPDEPGKGSGFRCVKLGADKVDPVVDAAARASGLDIAEIKSYLPPNLTIWIDPHEVSYRLAETEPVRVIYRGEPSFGTATRWSTLGVGDIDDAIDGEMQRVSWTTNPPIGSGLYGQPFGGRPFDKSPSPNWSMGGGGPPGATPNPAGTNVGPTAGGRLPPGPPTTISFTAATFAQTKFGSTKLKNQGPQRPTRLSPTDSLPGPGVGAAGGYGARLSPTAAGLPAWAIRPASPSPCLMSPLQQGASPVGLGTVDASGRMPPALQEMLLLHQHQKVQQQQQQHLQFMAALQQQQQQQHHQQHQHQQQLSPDAMHPIVMGLTSNLGQQQRQRHQQQMAAGATSPSVGFLATGMEDAATATATRTSLRDDVASSAFARPATVPDFSAVDWSFDIPDSTYAASLHHLLLAN